MPTLITQTRWNFKNDTAIAEAVRHARIPLCISDPNLSDNPIVFANQAFMDLTGFTEGEVIGQNCRFLQGEGTTIESKKKVRDAIAGQRVETIEILNYRKDGSAFVNALQIGPITDDDGKLIYFFGSQLDVSEKHDAEERARALAEQELIHRLRNIVNVMAVVIEMTAREVSDPKVMSGIVVVRQRALSDAHLQTINRLDDQEIHISDLIRTILLAYSPKGMDQYELEGPVVLLPQHLLSCIALGLHEFATNSVKYGALGSEGGRVSVAWDMTSDDGLDGLSLKWVESNGPKVVTPTRQSGSQIVRDLIESVGGSVAMEFEEDGLIVRAVFPF